VLRDIFVLVLFQGDDKCPKDHSVDVDQGLGIEPTTRRVRTCGAL